MLTRRRLLALGQLGGGGATTPAPSWSDYLDYMWVLRGAASEAAAYVDAVAGASLAAIPGTTAPTWSSARGLIFAGSHGLNTQLSGVQSVVVMFNALTQANAYLCGAFNSGTTFRTGISPYPTGAATIFGHGGKVTSLAQASGGVVAVCGQTAYRELASAVIPNGTPYSANVYLGGLNNGGAFGFGVTADIWAIGFSNSVLSEDDYLAVRAMLYAQYTDVLMVAFGDSIAAGSGATDADHRWPNLVAADRGWRLQNSGISGTVLQNTVQNTVATIGAAADNNGRDTYIARVRLYNPRRALVLYGLNDVLLDDAAFSAADYQNDLGEIVDGLVASGLSAGDIVIGSPPYVPTDNYSSPPRSAAYGGGSVEDHVAHVAAAAAVATAKGTKYADVYQAMVDGGGDALISGDGLHPNDAGHAVIAAAFLSVL